MDSTLLHESDSVVEHVNSLHDDLYEIESLFGALQSAADDLEEALDRVEQEADHDGEIAEAASSAKIELYSYIGNVERWLKFLRDVIEEQNEEVSASA